MGRALGGPTRHFKTHEPSPATRCPPRALDLAAFDAQRDDASLRRGELAGGPCAAPSGSVGG